MSPINRVPSNRVPPDEESALPPSYSESQRAELALRKVKKRKAESILDDLFYYQPAEKKFILEHAIKLLNEEPGQKDHQICLNTPGASQVNSRETPPELNRWINDKLSFFNLDDLGKLAFATGHWSTFKQSQDLFPHNVKKQMEIFFQEYFVKEGTDQGIAKLTGINYNRLFYAPANDKLNTAINALAEEYSVEVIQPDGQSSRNHAFNYLAVTNHVATRLTTNLTFFGRRLNIDHEECNRIEDTYHRNIRFQVFEMLNQFVEKSGPEDDLHTSLLNALEGVKRRDLKDALEAALKRENLI